MIIAVIMITNAMVSDAVMFIRKVDKLLSLALSPARARARAGK